MPGLDDLIAEARSALTVCNSCRYCEGYCPVFPALERGDLADGDVVFLANLCHDCRACFQACMYAPPHQFAVDIPTTLTAIRTRGYEELAWPGALTRLLAHPVATQVSAFGLGLVLALGMAVLRGNLSVEPGPGSFYRVIPSDLITGFFLALTLVVVVVLIGGFVSFWRRASGVSDVSIVDVARAVRDAALLRNLDGGGGGCFVPDTERPSRSRRAFHQMLTYGLLAAFAATVAAAAEQHLLGRLPPYPVLSVPVLLGIAGGFAVMIGAAGLAVLRWQARSVGSNLQAYAFISSLEAVAFTGMLLLVVRSSSFMPTVLIVHLAAVVGLYVTCPYGKFVHAVHRFGALVIDATEKRTLAQQESN